MPYYIKQCFGTFFPPGELISNLVTIETILKPKNPKSQHIFTHTHKGAGKEEEKSCSV